MERDAGRSETDLARLGRLRRADGACKPLWHIKKKALQGTCFRVCTVQVAEGTGLTSNLLHLKSLILCTSTTGVLDGKESVRSFRFIVGSAAMCGNWLRRFSRAPLNQPPNVLGMKRMTAAPARQIAAPLRSHASGLCFSTAHSQTSEAAM